ncbi:hypothetical protein DUI87_31249 [Hirundo rustica rustica]|uniref:Envelope protein n=1 Tax=Hirundo rustica rustica TaxID=333673 RepID=A0A3M0IU52_HIRRU|nr:hypothetical protein DUI87_31249 [Hirundo rustica rustica]
MKELSSCLILFLVALSNAAVLPVAQPKENVWETLANASGLDTICLTHSRPGKPFSTCLVGLPVSKWPIPENIPPEISKSIVDPVDQWDVWTKFLPAAPFEPQELEILGSVHMQFCVKFGLSGVTRNRTVDITPNLNFYRNSSSWCNYTKMLKKPSNHVPAQLPRGNFFICGDKIWPAIPANATGGPCSIGMLSLLTPDMTLMRKLKQRGKRSVQMYDPNCDDDVHTWSKAQRIAVAIFSPQAASGAALTQLDHVGCWLSKHARAVSLALSDMLLDIDSVRQASLQNRAAIDYLLLTHGHGCEEFEGMCCMNLSDHSKSIHENIRQLKESVNKLGEVTGSWMNGLFNLFDLSPLWKEILKIVIYILVGLLILLMILPCLFLCIRQAMDKVAKEVFLVQTGGGDVGVQGIPLVALEGRDLGRGVWDPSPELRETLALISVHGKSF